MISSVLGATIMVAATLGTVLAVELGESVIKNAGKYPLSQYERSIIISAGLAGEDQLSIKKFNEELIDLP